MTPAKHETAIQKGGRNLLTEGEQGQGQGQGQGRGQGQGTIVEKRKRSAVPTGAYRERTEGVQGAYINMLERTGDCEDKKSMGVITDK